MRRPDLTLLVPGEYVFDEGKPPRNGALRGKAKEALNKHIKVEKEWEYAINHQIYFLLERLYDICGYDYDIQLVVWDRQVRAKVDGLEFISTYYEMKERLKNDSIPNAFGLRLWWECPQCKKTKTSDIIFTIHELGQQIETFNPQITHRCKRKNK